MTTARDYYSLNAITDEDRDIFQGLKSSFWLNDSPDRHIMDGLTRRNYLAEPVCPECGLSDFYSANGTAVWDMASQDWILGDVFHERGFCGDCDYEAYSETVYYRREDVDNINAKRTLWADAAIQEFRCATGTDHEDALGDLLCDLMHWAHDHDQSFNRMLNSARGHYAAEIKGERVTRPFGTPAEEVAA